MGFWNGTKILLAGTFILSKVTPIIQKKVGIYSDYALAIFKNL